MKIQKKLTLNSLINSILVLVAMGILLSFSSNSKNLIKSDTHLDALRNEILADHSSHGLFGPPSFPTDGRLNIYNTLMSKADCGTNKLVEHTGPLDCTTFVTALQEFDSLYTSSSIDSLSLEPSKIAFNANMAKVLRNLANQDKFGLVFHYGMKKYKDSEDKQRDHIVYILGRGELYGLGDSIAHYPFINNNDSIYYLLDGQTDSIKPIGDGDLKLLTCQYQDRIRMNDSSIDPSKDPLMVYHEPKEFFNFFLESGLDDLNLGLFLYIGHGAVISDNVTDERHAPIFAFGDSTQFFPINNVGTPAERQFIDKGLDIGRQCPPNCPTPVHNCIQP